VLFEAIADKVSPAMPLATGQEERRLIGIAVTATAEPFDFSAPPTAPVSAR
jgi:hypothetical protein